MQGSGGCAHALPINDEATARVTANTALSRQARAMADAGLTKSFNGIFASFVGRAGAWRNLFIITCTTRTRDADGVRRTDGEGPHQNLPRGAEDRGKVWT